MLYIYSKKTNQEHKYAYTNFSIIVDYYVVEVPVASTNNVIYLGN